MGVFSVLVPVVLAFLAFLLWHAREDLRSRRKGKTADTRYVRKSWPRELGTLYGEPMLCNDDKDAPAPAAKPKPETKEEKEKRILKERDARSPASLVKRAQAKISAFEKDDDRANDVGKLVRSTVFYGKNDTGIHVFAEFGDGDLGIYHAAPDPEEDGWLLFEKAKLDEFTDIIERQKKRTPS